jgi:hypothetical protein
MECLEMLAYKIHVPGNYPEESTQIFQEIKLIIGNLRNGDKVTSCLKHRTFLSPFTDPDSDCTNSNGGLYSTCNCNWSVSFEAVYLLLSVTVTYVHDLFKTGRRHPYDVEV